MAADPLNHGISRCKCRSIRLFAGLVALAVWAIPFATPAQAQDGGFEREIRAVTQRIHELDRKADELAEVGRGAAADEVRREVQELQQRVHQAIERREREEHIAQLTETLEGLEHGLVALKRLGRADALEMLSQVADNLRREIKAARKQARRPTGPDRELEIVERQLEALHLAHAALREAERGDAAEALRRAIRAREVMLEGRRDEEALTIRRQAPNRDQIVRLLTMAEQLYREFRAPDRAERVGQLTRELWPSPDRSGAVRRQREAQAHRDARHEEQRRLMERRRRVQEEQEQADRRVLEARERERTQQRVRQERGRAQHTQPKEREVARRVKREEHQVAQRSVQREERQAAEQRAEVRRRYERQRAHNRDADQPEPARNQARQRLQHQLEIMRSALPALLEAGRRDAADLLERAVRARESALEARAIQEHAPTLGQLVEILASAAHLWEEFGHETKAAQLAELSRAMWADRDRPHDQPDKPHTDRRNPMREREPEQERDHISDLQRHNAQAEAEAVMHHLERIQERLGELQHALEVTRNELRQIRARRERRR